MDGDMVTYRKKGSHGGKSRGGEYNREDAPLNTNIMMLLRCIREVIGYCALSGSAPLAEMLYQINSGDRRKEKENWINNDFDFFVPHFPYKQMRADGKRTTDEDLEKEFFEIFEKDVLNKFASMSGIIPRIEKMKKHDIHHGYNFLSLSPGIDEIIQIELENGKSNVQIMVLNQIMNGNWDDIIPETFDINIVKLKVDCDAFTNLPKVSFVDHTAPHSLATRCFDYTVKPLQCFEYSRRRIQKYLSRGFKLRGLQFDPRITELWKFHWYCEARIFFLEQWLWEMSGKQELKKIKEQTEEENTKKKKWSERMVQNCSSPLQKRCRKERDISLGNFSEDVIFEGTTDQDTNTVLDVSSKSRRNHTPILDNNGIGIIKDRVLAFLPRMRNVEVRRQMDVHINLEIERNREKEEVLLGLVGQNRGRNLFWKSSGGNTY